MVKHISQSKLQSSNRIKVLESRKPLMEPPHLQWKTFRKHTSVLISSERSIRQLRMKPPGYGWFIERSVENMERRVERWVERMERRVERRERRVERMENLERRVERRVEPMENLERMERCLCWLVCPLLSRSAHGGVRWPIDAQTSSPFVHPRDVASRPPSQRGINGAKRELYHG